MFKKYNFTLMIESLGSIGFSEVYAPEISMDPVESREGKLILNTLGKKQGLVKYEKVSLKWGSTSDSKVFEWIAKADTGTRECCDAIITLNDENKKPIAEWTLAKAYPIKYISPAFKDDSNEIEFNALELACESIIRTK